ncbi:MAG: hypothetical protein JWP57_4399 [Spirosoma sp.]|nr:hypothetical protein [Spirosoma sp.]
MDGGNSTGPWWVVLQGAATPVCVAGWAAWRWWKERGDKLHVETLSREDRLAKDIEARQTTAATREADLWRRVSEELARKDADVTRLEARVGALDARITALDKEAEAWMERARSWQRRAHQVVHRLNNARFVINGMRSRSGMDELAFPDESLPPLEDIAVANEVYFNRENGILPRPPGSSL